MPKNFWNKLRYKNKRKKIAKTINKKETPKSFIRNDIPTYKIIERISDTTARIKHYTTMERLHLQMQKDLKIPK